MLGPPPRQETQRESSVDPRARVEGFPARSGTVTVDGGVVHAVLGHPQADR